VQEVLAQRVHQRTAHLVLKRVTIAEDMTMDMMMDVQRDIKRVIMMDFITDTSKVVLIPMPAGIAMDTQTEEEVFEVE
jgi:hypothetical protein